MVPVTLARFPGRGLPLRWLAAAALAVAAPFAAAARHDDSAPPPPAQALWVSTRARVAAEAPAERLGSGRGSLRYGSCRVVYGSRPVMERLAGSLDFYLPAHSERVAAVRTLAPPAFWEQLRGAGEAPARIVVFVHGYSYTFDRACRRGAALQRSLGPVPLLLFSWPSAGNPAAYNADVAAMEWSVPRLTLLLRELHARYPEAELALAAHSLGARGALWTLERLQLQDAAAPLLDQLVLIAPDIDAASFLERLPLVQPLFRQLTVYASADDTPLAVSARLHGHPRLGQAGDALVVDPGFETIDVSALRRYHPSAHEYYYFHPVAGADVVELLRTGAPASARRLPRPRERAGLRYWILEAPVGDGAAAPARARGVGGG